MVKYILLILSLFVSPAFSAPMIEWVTVAKTYHIQGLTLTMAACKVDSRDANESDHDVARPVLTIIAPGVAPYKVYGAESDLGAMANIGVGRFDPKAPLPQVEFATYTGGAHCCVVVSVIERNGRFWREVPLGSWDGDIPDNAFQDIDGDGTADFVRDDNSFLYTFSSYAGSFPPPEIFNVIDGKVIDVSKAPRFAKLFRNAMEDAEAKCAIGSNGACAGYVADAARLNQFSTAWKFMLAHYNPKDNWDYPAHCVAIITNGRTCNGKELKPRDFPQALRWFLEDQHYISKRIGE